MLTRRTFLATSSAAALAPALGHARAAPQVLVAAPSRQQIAPAAYAPTDIWSIGGTLPGTPLRFAQGERAQLTVQNDLPQATSLHWHGIRIENAMDGVPGLTQDPIPAGATFDYDFALPDAGTYWYHSHAQAVEQVERGLYGALIVAEADAPEVEADEVLVLDDIRLTQTAAISADFDAPHDASHAGRYGNVVLTNGQMDLRKRAAQGDRMRLRLINAANARIFQLAVQGMEGWIVALDGMPLAAPQPLTEAILLAPAQRVDLIVDVVAEAGEEAVLVSIERDGGYAQAVWDVAPGTAARRPAPAALPPNPDHPIGDLAKARRFDLRMEGGAMGGMRGAMLNGVQSGMRQMAQRGMFWALNGVAGRPEDPLADLALGETAVIDMINDTAFPHAMHLHGMHFSEVRPDGTLGPLRDTLLVNRAETRRIAFNAHNSGDWLMHCHMLSHHAAGMGTWLRVNA